MDRILRVVPAEFMSSTSSLPAVRLLRHPFARMRAWWIRRKASRQLHGFDDSQLKDIGLHRSEIDSKLIELDRNRWRTDGSVFTSPDGF
jgi:uncharacterized protein YjiS (DUF1127 family)